MQEGEVHIHDYTHIKCTETNLYLASKLCGEKQGFILYNRSSFQLLSGNALPQIQRFVSYKIYFLCSSSYLVPQRKELCSSLPIIFDVWECCCCSSAKLVVDNLLNFRNCPFQLIHTCAL